MDVKTARVFADRIKDALEAFRAEQVKGIYEGPARPDDDDDAGWAMAGQQAADTMTAAYLGLAEQPVMWTDAVARINVLRAALGQLTSGEAVMPVVEVELQALATLLSVTEPQLYVGWVEAVVTCARETSEQATPPVEFSLMLPKGRGRFTASQLSSCKAEDGRLFLNFHLTFEGNKGDDLPGLIQTDARIRVHSPLGMSVDISPLSVKLVDMRSIEASAALPQRRTPKRLA